MTKEEFENYKFTSKTEVKHDDCWHKVGGVYFNTGVLQFILEYRDSKGCLREIVDYSEIEDIRQSDEEQPTPKNIDEETIEKIKNRIKMHEEIIEELKLFTKK